MKAPDREEQENKGPFIYDRKRNQQKKKIYKPNRRGRGTLNKPRCSQWVEYCATMEMMFTEGL